MKPKLRKAKLQNQSSNNLIILLRKRLHISQAGSTFYGYKFYCFNITFDKYLVPFGVQRAWTWQKDRTESVILVGNLSNMKFFVSYLIFMSPSFLQVKLNSHCCWENKGDNVCEVSNIINELVQVVNKCKFPIPHEFLLKGKYPLQVKVNCNKLQKTF